MTGTESLSHRATERVAAAEGELIDGRYRVGESLGEGAQGLVYAAHDVWLDRAVAIKIVGGMRTSPEALERFQKEAQALARIRHANVVQIYAFGCRDDSYYFAMEYINGRDLGSLIEEANARGNTVPHERALEIIRDVGGGLEAAHDRGLVHRDVKPSNIVIEERTGRPVLIDFGLARRRTRTSPRLSAVAGTPWYMAPEQAKDTSGTETTPRADLYALACTAFELLTGRPVFEHDDPLAVLLAHVETPPPALSSVCPELAPLDAVLQRAMAKAPSDRYANVAAFLAALDDAAREIGPRTSFVRRSMPKAQRVRVVLLHRDDPARPQVERTIERALNGPGDYAEIQCVESRADLFAALMCEVPSIIVLDDESISVPSEKLVESLRESGGSGGQTEIVVLAEASAGGSKRLVELGARELPKPLNMNALASVIGKIGVLIAQRRRPRTLESAGTNG
jgi:eukaryotic-like serine/threonine-protein kinase